MVSRPDHPPPRAGHGLRARVQQLRGAASRQFITRNRRLAFGLSLAVVAIGVAAAHLSEWWFSPGVMILPILAGGLLLWVRALRVLFVLAAATLVYDIVGHKAGPGIVATIAVTDDLRRRAGPDPGQTRAAGPAR